MQQSSFKVHPIFSAMICVMIIATGLLPHAAHAHTRSQSFSSWELNGHQVTAIIAVDARRVTQLGNLYGPTSLIASQDRPDPINAIFAQHVIENLHIAQDDKSCSLENIKPLTKEGVATIRMRIIATCLKDTHTHPPDIDIQIFYKVSPTHIHIARLPMQLDGEDITRDVILRDGQGQFSFDHHHAPSGFIGFIMTGFHHVMSGLDHVLFLGALVLLVFATKPNKPIRLMIATISGFTVGHTLSLVLSIFGFIAPNVPLIESLIGLTIALAAIESVHRQNAAREAVYNARQNNRLLFAALSVIIGVGGFALITALYAAPLLLALLVGLIGFVIASMRLSNHAARFILPIFAIIFGVIHGAGFAGGLMAFQLQRDDLLVPMLGFNLGVELAQLLIMFAVLAYGFVLHHHPVIPMPLVKRIAALGLFAMGTYWFALRILGG